MTDQTGEAYLTHRARLQYVLDGLVREIEESDRFAHAQLAEYAAEPGVRVPCDPGTYLRARGRTTPWEVSGFDEQGVHFTHDCRDHGYDLACTESVVLPAAYIRDPEAWRAAQRQEEEDKRAARLHNEQVVEAASRQARRQQYERLRAEFEGVHDDA
jgi:hypothetical protein